MHFSTVFVVALACFVQTSLSQVIGLGNRYGLGNGCGNNLASLAGNGLAGNGLAGSSFGVGNAIGGLASLGQGSAAGYGDVSVAGELPVCGQTTVVGNVPIIGFVTFEGHVPAGGLVSVANGNGCNGNANQNQIFLN